MRYMSVIYMSMAIEQQNPCVVPHGLRRFEYSVQPIPGHARRIRFITFHGQHPHEGNRDQQKYGFQTSWNPYKHKMR